MPLYIGIQVFMDEAYRLFNIDMNEASNEIISYYKIEKGRVQYYLEEYINKYFKSKNLTLKCYDSGESRYVIGYKMEEFIKASHFIKLIEKLKYQFLYEIKDYNFNEITLQNSNCEDEIIDFTEPYIIQSSLKN